MLHDDTREPSELLTHYVLGELNDEERAIVESQLAMDQDYRDELVALEQATQCFRAASENEGAGLALGERRRQEMRASVGAAMSGALSSSTDGVDAVNRGRDARASQRWWGLAAVALLAICVALLAGWIDSGSPSPGDGAFSEDLNTESGDAVSTSLAKAGAARQHDGVRVAGVKSEAAYANPAADGLASGTTRREQRAKAIDGTVSSVAGTGGAFAVDSLKVDLPTVIPGGEWGAFGNRSDSSQQVMQHASQSPPTTSLALSEVRRFYRYGLADGQSLGGPGVFSLDAFQRVSPSVSLDDTGDVRGFVGVIGYPPNAEITTIDLPGATDGYFGHAGNGTGKGAGAYAKRLPGTAAGRSDLSTFGAIPSGGRQLLKAERIAGNSVLSRSGGTIDGTVTAVDSEHQLVVVSVNGGANVPVGTELEVFRAGQRVAKLRVVKAQNGMLGGKIVSVEPGQSIRVGDGSKSWQPSPDELRQRRIQRFLDSLCRRPKETPRMMFFRFWGDNPFVEAAKDSKSTFGLDVDTASFTLARRYLKEGHLPPPAAVRTEEFVNYHDSELPHPTGSDLFRITTEVAPSPYSHRQGVVLLEVGIAAKSIDAATRKPLSLTFVVDVSGSMKEGNRLELVKQAIQALLPELRSDDSIGIVSFNSSARDVLQPVKVSEIEAIAAALRTLAPGGSTNVEQGLELGYQMAKRHGDKERSDRVVLFSDGVANTGQTTAQMILATVAKQRADGVYLNTFGVGMGNHNDELLEQLADRGDGACHYIDSYAEALKVFRGSLTTTFQTIAKDVKAQIEFDPQRVQRFRQLGYENRRLAHQDFRNDTVDAGEINAGHEVVALYEVELRDAAAEGFVVDGFATVRLRYKDVDADSVVEMELPARRPIESFAAATAGFRLSATVAAFAELLRGSYWSNRTTFDEIATQARALSEVSGAGKRLREQAAELAELVLRAKQLDAQRGDREFSSSVDHYKRCLYRLSQLEGDEPTTALPGSDLERVRGECEAAEQALQVLLGRDG